MLWASLRACQRGVIGHGCEPGALVRGCNSRASAHARPCNGRRDSHSKQLYKALQCFMFDFWDGKDCRPTADEALEQVGGMQ